MKTKIVIVIALIGLLKACPAHGENITFTSSGQILPGESWNFVYIYNDDTIVDMLGGSADWIATYDASTLNVLDGSADIEAADFSIINVQGGDIGYIIGLNNATVNLFNSDDVIALGAEDFAQIRISGGSIGNLHAYGSGLINLYGGLVLGDITARDLSAINIYGYDLVKTDSGGAYGYGEVTGFLMDDTYISVDFFNSEAYGHVTLIPEPCTLVLVVLGGLISRKHLHKTGNFNIIVST